MDNPPADDPPPDDPAADEPTVEVDDDPVRAALARARGMTRATPASRSRRRAQRKADGDRQRRGGWTGPGPDEADPVPVGEVLAGYLGDRDWQQPIARARVFTHWEQIVGSEVAAHCAPTALRDGELKVSAESTAWATQLRLLGGTLLARVVADVGPELVTRIVITGPTGPSWKHGPRSVRGARGPRDTYG